MKQRAWLLAVLLVLPNCSSFYIGNGVCRHKALIAAIIAQEQGLDSKIAVGNIGGEPHNQAFVVIDGQKYWLHTDRITVWASRDKIENFQQTRETSPLWSAIVLGRGNREKTQSGK